MKFDSPDKFTGKTDWRNKRKITAWLSRFSTSRVAPYCVEEFVTPSLKRVSWRSALLILGSIPAQSKAGSSAVWVLKMISDLARLLVVPALCSSPRSEISLPALCRSCNIFRDDFNCANKVVGAAGVWCEMWKSLRFNYVTRGIRRVTFSEIMIARFVTIRLLCFWRRCITKENN